MPIQVPKTQVDEFESTIFHQLLNLIDSATPPEPVTPATQKAQPNQDISPASTVTPASIRENTTSPSMLSAKLLRPGTYSSATTKRLGDF